jgi:hypothetical protein
MLVATVTGVFLYPALFVLVERLAGGRRSEGAGQPVSAEAAAPPARPVAAGEEV